LSFTHSSGFGLSGAFGAVDIDEGAKNSRDPFMWFVGGHFERKFTELGMTTFNASYMETQELRQDNDEVQSFSVGVIQQIDAAAFELYAQYAHYEFDRNTGEGTADLDYKDVDAVMVGGRLKF
jgi:hypothetical protein